MKIKMRYDLLFKSGVKERVTQSATESEHIGILDTVRHSFREGADAIITFGDGTSGKGRYVRVADLSQLETEILKRDES